MTRVHSAPVRPHSAAPAHAPTPQNNPLVYAAFQTVANLAGAQTAGDARLRLGGWRMTPQGAEGAVRVDAVGFGGNLHGEVSVKLTQRSAVFTPDASPPQPGAIARQTGRRTGDDPFIRAAKQTLTGLGVPLAGVKLSVADWRGDAAGVVGRVRVDSTSASGGYHGFVKVVFETTQAAFAPDAAPP